jgi:hypothetical protein
VSSALHDVTPLLGAIEDLRARAVAAQPGPSLLELAEAGRRLAVAVADAPIVAEPTASEFVALSADDGPMIVGPDFVLDSSDAGLSIQTGDVMLFVTTSHPTRVFLSEAGRLIADWSFSELGDATDNLDVDAEIDRVADELAAVVEDAIALSGGRESDPLASGADPVHEGDRASAVDSAGAPVSPPDSDVSSGAGAVIGAVAAREIARRLRSATRPTREARAPEMQVQPEPTVEREDVAPQPADRAPDAAWQPTHRVPATPLDAYAVHDLTQSPVAVLDPHLDVAVFEWWGDWAHIRCSNGWTCWVDGRFLVPLR